LREALTNYGLVTDDDYDAEFRYDRAPIGALQGLSSERVARAGCVGTTLTPCGSIGLPCPAG
jgi:GntR family transcriptional regulator/MocR family aminotransferase